MQKARQISSSSEFLFRPADSCELPSSVRFPVFISRVSFYSRARTVVKFLALCTPRYPEPVQTVKYRYGSSGAKCASVSAFPHVERSLIRLFVIQINMCMLFVFMNSLSSTLRNINSLEPFLAFYQRVFGSRLPGLVAFSISPPQGIISPLDTASRTTSRSHFCAGGDLRYCYIDRL